MDSTLILKNCSERSKKVEPVLVKKETDQNALSIDRFSVTWKRKLKTKLTADIIGHIPKEISRAVLFFINHRSKVTGSVYSSKCFPPSVSTRGLEVLIDCDFKIEASKLNLLERLKDTTERNYDESVNQSISATYIISRLFGIQAKSRRRSECWRS